MRLILLPAALLALAACNPVASDSSGRESGGRTEEPASAPAEPAGAPADAPVQVIGGIDMNEPIDASGTEPFWGLRIRSDVLELVRPDHKMQAAVNRGLTVTGQQAVWVTTTTTGTPLRVMLTAAACSNGMSDQTFPLSATVEIGDETLRGCAEPPKPPVGQKIID